MFSVYCFPLTSSDSDFQFRVKIIARRRRRTAQTLCETLRLCVRIKIYPFCPSVKIIAHRQKYTEFCFACFCESPRRLRETIIHAVWVLCFPCIPCENYCTQTSQNNADALRNFAPLRENKDLSFLSFCQNHCTQNAQNTQNFCFAVNVF